MTNAGNFQVISGARITDTSLDWEYLGTFRNRKEAELTPMPPHGNLTNMGFTEPETEK